MGGDCLTDSGSPPEGNHREETPANSTHEVVMQGFLVFNRYLISVYMQLIYNNQIINIHSSVTLLQQHAYNNNIN
jgi:hypothetical protein